MRNFLLCFLASPVIADQFPVSRCVNFDQALEAPKEGDWGYTISYEDIVTDPDKHADMFFDIWAELSTHYARYDHRLIFELLNEPSENLKTPRAVSLFESVYPTIRSDHPDRWIIIEGAEWAEISALQDLPLIDDKTALSFHYYSPYTFTHQKKLKVMVSVGAIGVSRAVSQSMTKKRVIGYLAWSKH